MNTSTQTNPKKQRAIIIGAGVIGIASAYYLSKRGVDVTVVERLSEPAAIGSCSFQNGGLICPGLSSPWARPSAWRVFLNSIFNPLSGFKFRLGNHVFHYHFWKWLYYFKYYSGDKQSYPQRRQNLQTLAFDSATEYKQILTDIPSLLSPSPASLGALAIFKSRDHCLSDVNELNHMRGEMGLTDLEVHTGDKKEVGSFIKAQYIPTLKSDYSDQIQAVWISPDDFSSNCRTFTQNLANFLASRGVKFLYGRKVKNLQHDQENVTGIVMENGEELSADHYIVTTGSSVDLFKSIGIFMPVFPMKGYSLDIPIKKESTSTVPTISLSNEDEGIYITRINDSMRVVGFAELDGNIDIKNNDEKYYTGRSGRFQQLMNYAKNDLGMDLDYENAQKYTCYRPVSADGIPIIGRVGKYTNLYACMGHAQLGWTLACGSGSLLARIVTGEKRSKVDGIAFDPNRFNH